MNKIGTTITQPKLTADFFSLIDELIFCISTKFINLDMNIACKQNKTHKNVILKNIFDLLYKKYNKIKKTTIMVKNKILLKARKDFKLLNFKPKKFKNRIVVNKTNDAIFPKCLLMTFITFIIYYFH